MSKINSGKSEQPESELTSFFSMFEPGDFTKSGARNLEAATRAARAYYNGVSKLNQEMIDFINARVKADIETAKTFITAKNSESAFHTQAEFVEGAIRAYADEVSRIMHLAADMAHETLTPVEERTEEVLHKLDEHADAAKPKAAAE